jgi:ABC-type bacteriocin/lantibiotic exporter with double-glycine peptidase domain
MQDDNQPVALIPCSVRGYNLCDPATGSSVRITARLAETIAVQGRTFYRPFPTRVLTSLDLLKMSMQNCRPDLYTVLIMGVCGALLGLFTPWVTGIIFDTIVPEASRSQLWQVVALLMTCAFVTMLFDLT